MNAAHEDLLFGRIAVHLGLVTAQDLAIVTSAQQRAPTWRPIGQLLVDEGLLTQAQVEQVLAQQRERLARLGQTASPASPAAPRPTPPAPPPPAASPPARAGLAFDAIRAFALEDDAAPPAPFRAPPAQARTPAEPVRAPFGAPPRTNPFGAVPPSNATAPPANATTTTPAAATTPPTTTRPAPLPLPAPPPGYAPFQASLDVQGRPSPRPTDARALHHVLREAVRLGASDVHLHSGARLRFRLAGALSEMPDALLSPWRVGETVIAALTEEEYESFCRDGELDFPYTVDGVGRFRVNLYKQQHGIDAVFRSLPARPPSLAELGLPRELGKLANYHQGIVLFTGPSGCGKSATMNAVLNLVNQERTDHIITIEDPTEVLHESAQSIVNQRQAKKHTASFGRALRAALREDPDVIVIGEMRDHETISLAVSAAETGHLVMGTLHTGSAIRTITRLLSVFPPSQQSQVRSMVSESLRAIISQRLVARADGNGRVAALEVLYVNQAVANLIRENRTLQIKSVLQTGQASGMCGLDMSLEQLVKDGVITKQEAARHADEPRKFQ